MKCKAKNGETLNKTEPRETGKSQSEVDNMIQSDKKKRRKRKWIW